MGLARWSSTPLLILLGLCPAHIRAQQEAAPCPAARVVAHPNVLLDVSSGYVNAGLSQEKTQLIPIRQMNQGTLITGTYQAVFRTTTELVLDDRRWLFDVYVHGSGSGCAVAERERLELKGRFCTPFRACKRFAFDQDGMSAQPAGAEARCCMALLDVAPFVHGPILDRVGERVVGRYFERRKGEYEANVAQTVKRRLEEGFERAAAQQMDEANRNYRDSLRLPLERQGLFPSELSFQTTPTHLRARAF